MSTSKCITGNEGQKERWCLLAAVNVREEHAVKLPDVNVSLLHVGRFLGDSLLSVIKVCFICTGCCKESLGIQHISLGS